MAPQSGKGLSELWARLRFVLVAIIVYRIGTHIPVPGINPDRLQDLFQSSQGTLVELFNVFSGGSLERMSILALNVIPYISASIIMQLLSAVSPRLSRLRKEGEAGRRVITQYTRYGTLGLATLQSAGLAAGLASQGLAIEAGISFHITAILAMVTGTMFLMWLGEQITEKGIGNGISLIIFVSIVSGLPSAIGQSLEQARQGELSPILLLGISLMVITVIALVVFIERGQRRLTVQYPKRQVGRRQMAAQSSHLPLKINMAGVIPAIFASSLLLFPASLSIWLGEAQDLDWLQQLSLLLQPPQPLYIISFTALIVFFSFFYTALVFDPDDVANNLKKQGAYLPGIRPGARSAGYIEKIITRLTVFGAAYVALVCLLPLVLVQFAGVPFYFGGTSLLIVVVVAMDIMSQLQAHMMSYQYESLMRKSNIRGRTRR
ncbi:MAG: preprotein translocase subunit SecY [Gammaproteobacteria bacterium]